MKNIFCLFKDSSSPENKITPQGNMSCTHGQFIKFNKCYLFIWYKGRFKRYLKNERISFFKRRALTYQKELIKLNFLFNSIKVVFSPIILDEKIITFKRHFDTYFYKSSQSSDDYFEGYYIYEISQYSFVKHLGSNIFSCANGNHISINYICDGIRDCMGASADKSNCTYTTLTDPRMPCSFYHKRTQNNTCIFT